MLYKERLTMTRSVIVYVLVYLAFALLGTVIALLNGRHATVTPAEVARSSGFFLPLFATMVATSLGAETGASARYALIRPVPRVRYALGVFGCGLLAVVAAFVLSSALGALVMGVLDGYASLLAPANARAASSALLFAMPLAHALAWYGVVAAASLFFRNNFIAAAIAWPSAVLLFVLSQVHGLGAVRYINLVNPLEYYIAATTKLESPQYAGFGFFSGFSATTDAVLLVVLCAAALAVGTLRWQRLEV